MKTKTEIGGVKLEVKGDITKGDCFFVVGPGYYGYGNTIKQAKETCIKAGCKRTMKMVAFYGDANIGVTGMGEIQANDLLVNLGEV